MFPHPQYVPDTRQLHEQRCKASEPLSSQHTPAFQRGPSNSDVQPAHASCTDSSENYANSAICTNARSRINSGSNTPPSPVFESFDSSFFNSPTPSVRLAAASTRRSSATTAVSERISDFAGKVRKQFQRKRKQERKHLPRVVQPNILDKPETKKLNKFWDLADPDRHSVASSEDNINNTRVLAFEQHSWENDDVTQSRPDHFLTVREFLLENRQSPATQLIGLAPNFRPRFSSISERSRATQDSASTIMDFTRLMPGERAAAEQQDKARRVEDARGMYETIKRNAERSNTAVPPYEFLELIGKGAYGRVYKCRDQRNGDLVAIKIAEVEWEDSSAKLQLGQDRESSIREVQKEVKILQTLKDNKAKNINVIHDAFDLHSQLWIITDYCTGGSVRTLQRPFHTEGKTAGFPEHFIIPIARELAIAMKSLHDMRIVHRDIKASNIYITEEGALQLGDFGVTAIAEDDRFAKRKTVIGTKNYMPLELLRDFDKGVKEDGYGGEVDVYAYGCTIIEMATGTPPFSRIHGDDLDAEIVAQAPPRLDDESISVELRDLTNTCLSQDPGGRPSAEDILKHPAIADSEKKYTTSSLIKLIEKFKLWEHGGGSRISLWWAGGADRPTSGGEGDVEQASESDDADGWTFSTSDDFDRRFSQMPTLNEDDLQSLQASHGAGLSTDLGLIDTKGLSVAERIKREHSELSANRGEKSLARLYNINDPSGYQISTPKQVEEPTPASDLPLREFTAGAPTRESMIEIDLDEAGASGAAVPSFSLPIETVNDNTIRPSGRRVLQGDEDDDHPEFIASDPSGDKRATMEWTFSTAQVSQSNRDTMEWTVPSTLASQSKRGTMEWTFQTAEPAPAEESDFLPTIPSTEPLVEFSGGMEVPSTFTARDSMASIIDLGSGERPMRLDDPAEIVRPTTASSTAASDMTSGNPFDLEDDPILTELDRKRFSFHKQWQSEGGHLKRQSHKAMAMHARGSSFSSTDSDSDARIGTTRRVPYSARQSGFHLGPDPEMSPEDINQWPNFSDSESFDTYPRYQPRLGDASFAPTLRETGTDMPGLEIQLPAPQAPHQDALAEDADLQLLDDELFRSLDDLAFGIKGVENALRRYANIGDEDEHDLSSDGENSRESAKEGVEDKVEAIQLTSRRNKPRKLELRSSPHSATMEGLH